MENSIEFKQIGKQFSGVRVLKLPSVESSLYIFCSLYYSSFTASIRNMKVKYGWEGTRYPLRTPTRPSGKAIS